MGNSISSPLRWREFCARAKPASLLWLIRAGKARTCDDLLAQLNLSDSDRDYHVLRLLRSHLTDLESAGFLTQTAGEYQVTPTTESLRSLLGVSLTELAESDLQPSMRVRPLFGLPQAPGPGQSHSDLFVLMPFQPELSAVYQDHIKLVASRLQLTVARADDFFTTHSVTDDIWAAILDSRIVIADCTGRNPNVFYEIGIAHTLGKPVVLLAQNADDVPFDLRHRHYLEYQFTPRGMTDFEDRLGKVIKVTLYLLGDTNSRPRSE